MLGVFRNTPIMMMVIVGMLGMLILRAVKSLTVRRFIGVLVMIVLLILNVMAYQ